MLTAHKRNALGMHTYVPVKKRKDRVHRVSCSTCYDDACYFCIVY